MDPQERTIPTDAVLDEMQWVGDPHADDTVAAIVGTWSPPFERAAGAAPALSARAATGDAGTVRRLGRIDELNAIIRDWKDNAGVAAWVPRPGKVAPDIAAAVHRYVSEAASLPPWADPERIARAEKMFMDHGPLSVTILFCASLPECYVVPDLAAVLHATGQLEDRAEHRIRSTGGMIFPVMMRGGLTSPTGSGIAQILKVRLIHATVRNLILRGPPEAAVAALRSGTEGSGRIEPLAKIQPDDSMHGALHVHGWQLAANGLPNNQEELAYTLLTFSYVFLRSMRRLGLAFEPEQEEDYLHAWNVVGHFLGIRRELMVDTMAQAQDLFGRMQARGRADWAKRPGLADPRPQLGGALMDATTSVFHLFGPFRKFPVLLTRHFIEYSSARELGLNRRVSWLARLLFAIVMVVVRVIDRLVRLVFPDFSLARLFTRVIGYRLTCTLLMNKTRELSVPEHLRARILATIAGWGEDPKASRRMNALEDRLTTHGDWEALHPPSSR